MILFPDGMVGRAFGPVAGRRHDLFLAKVSRLLALITHGALQGFRLFGDKAYIGFGANILHPVLTLMRAPSRLSGMSTLRDTALRSST